nr:[NiFe]-hydrogenase assembly chaperone HybE [Thiorhodococcus minor]
MTLAFERIHRERMAGLPILHPSLSVEVVGGRIFDGDWVGALVTPWTMNLVLVPGPGSAHRPGGVGIKQTLTLPGAEVETIGSEEADVGAFLACSLYSPMGAFADQATAVATAAKILEGLLPSESPRPKPLAPQPDASPAISRRDLLRGRLRRT